MRQRVAAYRLYIEIRDRKSAHRECAKYNEEASRRALSCRLIANYCLACQIDRSDAFNNTHLFRSRKYIQMIGQKMPARVSRHVTPAALKPTF